MKDLGSALRKKIIDAMRKGRIEQRDGIYRFSERIGGIPRGTVVIGKRVVYGYPKIRRVFSLIKGAEKNLHEGEIWVEEKIDGYNLRAVYSGGKIMCISRGGFLDFFATEKVGADENVREFFSENPEGALYMEMVGNTPYTRGGRGFGVKYYIFDVGDGKGNYLGPEDRERVCRKYGLRGVPLIKRIKHSELGKLRRIAISLDKSGAEGMVLKQENPRKVMKFVVPSSDIRDLGENAHLIFDMPAGFMKQRVFRCALSVGELGLNKGKYGRMMGEALHKSLHDAIRGGGEVGETFEITVAGRKTWEKVLEHMSREVEIKVEREAKVEGGLRIRFKKRYKEGSRRLRRALGGYAQAD
jgi:putative ATP-dependent DNA ligase